MRLRRPSFSKQKFIHFVKTPSRRRTITSYVLVAIISLFVGMNIRNFLPVAVVNGDGIGRKDFTERVLLRAGAPVMDQLIVSKLILTEADKRRVVVTEKEIDTHLQKIEAELTKNNSNLGLYLATQGMTLDMFRLELRTQLIVEKLFGGNSTPTSKEIDDYFVQNNIKKGTGAIYVSQNLAIKKQVRIQKLRNSFQVWLQKELKEAEILRLI